MTCDQQRFERDVADHVMTIRRDDGVDRHITFKKPGDSSYWFEILTWPGALCIRGDCGTYVFSRLTDMFEFFREKGNDPKRLYINPGYWCEKLQAVDCNGYGSGAAKRFSADRFRERVKERVEQHLEGKNVSADRLADLWEIIDGEILDHVYDGSGQVAFHCLYQFNDADFPRLFEDCCEWNCDEYEFGFMWNLFAIAWAIRTYDAAKAEKQPA